MPYQSPLHLLDSLRIQPDELSPEGLVRLRKKLLAEFNLSTEVTISVGNRQYTKDEALKAIDRLKDLQHLSEHAVIFRDKPLLAWLERPTEEPFPVKSVSDRRWSGHQDAFFEGIVADALFHHCTWLIRRRKFSVAKEPLAVAFALPDELQEDLLAAIYEQLQEIVSTIEEAIESPNHAQDMAAFGFIVYDDWPEFLNGLPQDMFQDVINDFCVNAVNYTVAVQHQQRPFVYEITHQLVRIRCDDSLKTTIQNNYVIYRENYYDKPGESKTESRNYWWIGWLVIMGIRAVASCDS